MKLGKKPPQYDNRDLLMASFLDVRKLPTIPEYFGHEGVIPPEQWRMLGNEKWGDCVFAGAAHEHMLLGTLGGDGHVFNENGVLADYSTVTGFDPSNPATDQGTLVRDAMKFRRETGVQDFMGHRHKIVAYISIEPGNLEHVYAAMYLFGCVGVGVEFPDSAMDQYEAGQPWSVVPGSQSRGGHYVPLIAKQRNAICVTWGKLQEVTETFLIRYMDECWAFITEEYVNKNTGKTIDGFAIDELLEMLKHLIAY